ncbi:alanyl-tRNA editing protein AlaXM [Hyperthermus butylicus]|uniref:Metal-dependent hydrolase n=1 Tax=Hyperthermus butylicus (strain DSM 5456 / JCM 9403 / PLM1-5) TaxID=415426 RepID=A2BM37_HYPBU|nr:alanyl-tRNA editing protein AlaXM [Hyperthermus butylicus]ABM81048.1 putative metal-dependent hydrolase [Hyperthermus butylicus DSM 5456]
MPAKLLFQEDSYLKEFDAIVTRVEGNAVFLEATAFHPRPSGGLDADHGILILPDGSELRVVDVVMREGDVAHIVDGDLSKLHPGMRVHGVIDWERRYQMMKLHTASHILLAVLYNKYGARVTGGHITPETARDDLEINVDDWKSAVRQAVEEANQIIRRCIEVKVYWLPREEALRIPGIVKLADKLPPDVEKLRIVEIPGVDIQADGGPHVRNTCEIPGIKIVKLESRGRRRKRVYYTLLE